MKLLHTDLVSLTGIVTGGLVGLGLFGPHHWGDSERIHVHEQVVEQVDVSVAARNQIERIERVEIIRPNPSADPLVYVDGVRVDGGIPDLDPEGIDRIEVIKGDAALRLYGDEAENGVIQIFTKQHPAPSGR